MNISKLYAMQKLTDARIIREKELEEQDLLPSTVLGLQVEICELANEWRGFKHWSNDRQPRPGMLTEYADALHMFLSLANIMRLPASELETTEEELKDGTTETFTELLQWVSVVQLAPDQVNKRVAFRMSLYLFINLGLKYLEFTWEQIVKAFVEKDAVNHQRQDAGY